MATPTSISVNVITIHPGATMKALDGSVVDASVQLLAGKVGYLLPVTPLRDIMLVLAKDAMLTGRQLDVYFDVVAIPDGTVNVISVLYLL